MSTPPNALWAAAFVDALAMAGVGHVCVSPGSRSSPLTLAVAEREELTTSVHIDERSAGFFALGYGRLRGRPAALLCTSGTAAANYLPAVIEASYSRVPMIVLSADRPPELRDTGAWQAIDQIQLYGSYARWFVDVASADNGPEMLRYLRNIAGRAVAMAMGRPAGPVHLNLPFREPLGGDWTPRDRATVRTATALSDPPRFALGAVTAGDEILDELSRLIRYTPRGLIVCGQIDPPPGYAEALSTLAAASGYPLLAEPCSGLRFGPHDLEAVVTGYDACQRSANWRTTLTPHLVLRFGASPIWRHVSESLAEPPDAVQIVVDPGGTWDDPQRVAALRVAADPVPLCQALAQRSGEAGLSGTDERRAWRAVWLAAADVVRRVRGALMTPAEPGTSAWVYRVVVDHLPDGAVLYAANSMAVRDLDSFTDKVPRAIRAVANRGAAGIDGTLSSALGAAFASRAPTVLMTGDLAFLHDVNGLAVTDRAGLNLTVVVLNDKGGGIFEYLPIAEQAGGAYERFFVTPPGADLAAACSTYGVAYRLTADPGAFATALGTALAAPGVQVIEVPLDRVANTAAHRRYWAEVEEFVDTLAADWSPGPGTGQ